MDLLVIISIVLLLIMVGLGWLIIRRAGEPDPFSIRLEDFSMDRAWASVREMAGEQTGNEHAAMLGDSTRDAVYKDLLVFEQQLKAESAQGALLMLRRELMDSVDRRILNEEILALPPARRNLLRSASTEVIQTDDQARRYINANELRLQVLREYAGGRYSDKAAKDWFAVYEKAAGMRRRTLARFLERSATGDLQQAEDARQQAITMVDGQLRSRLLQVAPGTVFRQLDDTARDSAPENAGENAGTEAGEQDEDRRHS